MLNIDVLAAVEGIRSDRRLAEHLGWHYNTLANKRRDQGKLTETDIEQAAAAFDVPVLFLLMDPHRFRDIHRYPAAPAPPDDASQHQTHCSSAA